MAYGDLKKTAKKSVSKSVIKMYKYETHLHTAPVSKCATATVEESIEFYKKMGYDGVFVTNHFVDGNINCDRTRPYKEQLDFYFSDYERALEIGEKIGLKVFLGVELSYKGTDFLVYGLDKFAGSDNHTASKHKKLAGVCSKEPVCSVQDFIEKVKNLKTEVFAVANDL